MALLLLILGLVIIFVGLVVAHEFGHFIIARRNGVAIEEFGIGFPPRIWSRKLKNGCLFSINVLPLGGFVRLHGEHDTDTGPNSFGVATIWVKTKILLAGVFMNLLVAFVLLTTLAWIGMPQLVSNQFSVASDAHTTNNKILIGYVEPGSPAQRAGLKSHDRLEAIGQAYHLKTITSAKQLPALTAKLAGQVVTIRYVRDGQISYTKAMLRSAAVVATSERTNGLSQGYLGVSPVEYTLIRSTWSAPLVAAGLIRQFTILTFHGLGVTAHAIAQSHYKKASSQVSGPVGLFVILRDGSLLGYQFVLSIIAVISLTLALINVLPIPALDGGRLFVLLVSRFLRKPLSQNLEERISATGFAILFLLMILITISDVSHLK
ncbi:MAG TPA: M50 family metallopeptidase [Candidatus Saccharimonadales bacterium]|nr:M50 family metallopeptidase [Candidatus Saccharimonadales bacterium]